MTVTDLQGCKSDIMAWGAVADIAYDETENPRYKVLSELLYAVEDHCYKMLEGEGKDE